MKISYSQFGRTVLRHSIKVIFAIISIIRGGKIIYLTDYSLFFLRQHKLMPNLNLNSAQLLNQWDRTNQDFALGFFDRCFTTRAKLLDEAHRLFDHEINAQTYSYEFATNIGHLAMLAIHQKAQEIDLLPKNNFVLPVHASSHISHTWIPLLFPSLDLNLSAISPTWTELPINWNQVEKFPIFRTKDGYVDQFRLTENFYSKANISKTNRVVSLDFEYLERARQQLWKMGLPQGAPFVVLHIRDGKGVGVRRGQSPVNFIKTIDELIRLGYWVVRIGDSEMNIIQSRNNFLDLTSNFIHNWLHPYLLHEATMFIGTNSGPSWMSQIFGTPTLMTNTTSLARSTLSGCRNTLYIPKKVKIKGKFMTLRELLNHFEGYSELDNDKLTEYGIEYYSNSDMEIMKASLELLELVQSGYVFGKSDQLYAHVDKIRSQSNAIAFGFFARSFYDLNEWFFE